MTIQSVQEVKDAVERAEREIRRAELAVGCMASVCAGRLQSARVGHWDLVKLKKELANYNTHTRRWK